MTTLEFTEVEQVAPSMRAVEGGWATLPITEWLRLTVGDRWPINVALVLAGLVVLGVVGLFAGTALR